MPIKINLAHIRANLKKKEYHDSLKMEMTRMGNKANMGKATRM
jgi:hypothetical protein